MKLSEKWLREFVDPSLSTEELAEQLTMAGFEVDSVSSCEVDFDKVIVARVEKVSPHPDADSQKICKVNTGEAVFTVVCGANNVVAGQCFALAVPGASLPGKVEIQVSQIRGIESEGMLCSASELGLSDDSEKLFELHESAKPGMSLSDYLELDDHILELSLTPNRGDCFSIRGISRELSAINQLPTKSVDSEPLSSACNESRKVKLQAADACPRYAGRVIQGVDVSRRAPDFILERLRRADIRSINIVVDLTNYVMLETGQPMHAFDNDKLNGTIDVRWSSADKQLTLLDGQTITLQENTLLITDENGPLALAGIMGGLDSAVSDDTVNLFLESAFFSPDAIAGRARSYGLHTDASLRYERGVDFCLQELAIDRLTQLILNYAGGKAGPLVVEENSEKLPDRSIVTLNLVNIERLLGIEIEKQEVVEILERLELKVSADAEFLNVEVPSWRFDIGIEADLIEEIARLVGYDNIPSSPPLASLSMFGERPNDALANLQNCLMNRGYREVITYSFVDQQIQETLLGPTTPIPLLNPISADLAVMRASLLPGLLNVLSYNHNRQQDRIRLFEYGRIFEGYEESGQKLKLGGIIHGEVFKKQWDRGNISSDLFDIKSDIDALLDIGCGVQGLEYRKYEHISLHPGQSAQIFIENQLIGLVGAIHPETLTRYGLSQATFFFELDLSLISEKKPVKFEKFSKYPGVKRDISVLIEEEIAVDRVLTCIKSEAKSLLHNLELFDLYQGEGIDLGKKSLALGLTFQTSSSTLTEEEVGSVMSRIMSALYSEFGATLRE